MRLNAPKNVLSARRGWIVASYMSSSNPRINFARSKFEADNLINSGWLEPKQKRGNWIRPRINKGEQKTELSSNRESWLQYQNYPIFHKLSQMKTFSVWWLYLQRLATHLFLFLSAPASLISRGAISDSSQFEWETRTIVFVFGRVADDLHDYCWSFKCRWSVFDLHSSFRLCSSSPSISNCVALYYTFLLCDRSDYRSQAEPITSRPFERQGKRVPNRR